MIFKHFVCILGLVIYSQTSEGGIALTDDSKVGDNVVAIPETVLNVPGVANLDAPVPAVTIQTENTDNKENAVPAAVPVPEGIKPPVVSETYIEAEADSVPVPAEDNKNPATQVPAVPKPTCSNFRKRLLCNNKRRSESRCANVCIEGGFDKGICHNGRNSSACVCHYSNTPYGYRVDYSAGPRSLQRYLALKNHKRRHNPNKPNPNKRRPNKNQNEDQAADSSPDKTSPQGEKHFDKNGGWYHPSKPSGWSSGSSGWSGSGSGWSGSGSDDGWSSGSGWSGSGSGWSGSGSGWSGSGSGWSGSGSGWSGSGSGWSGSGSGWSGSGSGWSDDGWSSGGWSGSGSGWSDDGWSSGWSSGWSDDGWGWNDGWSSGGWSDDSGWGSNDGWSSGGWSDDSGWGSNDGWSSGGWSDDSGWGSGWSSGSDDDDNGWGWNSGWSNGGWYSGDGWGDDGWSGWGSPDGGWSSDDSNFLEFIFPNLHADFDADFDADIDFTLDIHDWWTGFTGGWGNDGWSSDSSGWSSDNSGWSRSPLKCSSCECSLDCTKWGWISGWCTREDGCICGFPYMSGGGGPGQHPPGWTPSVNEWDVTADWYSDNGWATTNSKPTNNVSRGKVTDKKEA